MTGAATTRSRAATPVWLTVVIAGGIGLFYAYVVFSALDLLVRQATGPLGLNGLGWFIHILAVAVPMLVFGAAFALGFRRRPWQFALIMLTGFTLAAAFWMNVVAYGVTSYSLYGG